jgi:hypothetical protein
LAEDCAAYYRKNKENEDNADKITAAKNVYVSSTLYEFGSMSFTQIRG